MPLFPLPSIEQVLAASTMTVGQFNPNLTQNQFEAEVATLIADAYDFILGGVLEAAGNTVWPPLPATIEAKVPSLNGDEEQARQIRQATTATELEALARLWEEAGNLDDEYDEESDRQRKNADRELQSLQNSIRLIRGDGEPDKKRLTIKRPRSSVVRLRAVS